MANITAGNTSYKRTNNNFIDLASMAGSGESTMFVSEVTGILLGIEVRDGSYEVTDRRTGQLITRPNSWTSHWLVQDEDGSQRELLMSWPTYVDEQGNVAPWSRYAKTINLAACSANGTILHFWKDGRNFYHLEVVEVPSNLNPMPIMDAPANQAGIPWEN